MRWIEYAGYRFLTFLVRLLPRGAVVWLGRRRAVLPTIPGMVPGPEQRGAGCYFAGRCPRVTDRCRVDTPALGRVGQLVQNLHADHEAEGIGSDLIGLQAVEVGLHEVTSRPERGQTLLCEDQHDR